MKNYFYCGHCNELIHKDSVGEWEGNPACLWCRRDLEHSEDIEEGDEFYEAMKSEEKELINRLIESKI